MLVFFPQSEDNDDAVISSYRVEGDVLGIDAQRSGVTTSDILYSSTEVKSITTSASAYDIGGQFILSFEGHGTELLDYDISAKDMEVALDQLSTIGDVEVERFDKDNGLEWLVTFVTNSGDNHFTSASSHRTDRIGDVPPILVSTILAADTSTFTTSSAGGSLSGTEHYCSLCAFT